MIKKINDKKNILNDNIAFVEQWDFSTANLNEENRILAITQVASICYQSPKALGSQSLYDRLMAESMGLPSSSFEFVPVLLDFNNEKHKKILNTNFTSIKKFSEIVENGKYLLTNFRALIYDYENNKINCDFDIRKIFNTEEECKIIKKYFKVFLYKIDLPTRSQMVRHRINWQELSRRYVSGKKVPFDFYISEKMKNLKSNLGNTQDILNICIEHYFKALENGIKPQEARRIIPQACYSQIWGGFLPTQLNNFFDLRLNNHAQWEIRQIASAMKSLLEEE